MNLPTILIGLIIVALLVFDIRYLVKNGMCSVCETKETCRLRKSTGCSGYCAECRGCPYASVKAAPVKH